MRDSSLPRFAARIGLAASDVAFPLVIALVLTLGFASPAYAYVDPSVMTYTIQALAGVAVALSAVLGVVWRRMRRHLLHILRIEEVTNLNVHKYLAGPLGGKEQLGAQIAQNDIDALIFLRLRYLYQPHHLQLH